jgi:hypothetical protein
MNMWIHAPVGLEGKRKFKYLLPLDDEIAERVRMLARAYPQMRATSETIDTSGTHPEKGGEIPTVALQSSLTSD